MDYKARLLKNDVIEIETTSYRKKDGSLTINCPPINKIAGKKIKLKIKEIKE